MIRRCIWRETAGRLTFFGFHLSPLGLGLGNRLEKFGVQALGACLLDGAENSGAQLGAVRLFAACACAFGHCAESDGECVGEWVFGRVSWSRRRRLVGKSSRNFGGKAFGVSSQAGPCPGRVLRLVAGDADFGISQLEMRSPREPPPTSTAEY